MRKRLGITQKELASAAGVSQALIARIEAGTIDPRLSTLRKIMNALNKKELNQPKIKDIMHSPVLSVGIDEPLENAVQLMWKNGISQLPVFRKSKVVGSIREDNILKEFAKGNVKDLLKRPVADFIEESFPVVSIDSDIEEVSRLLSAKNPAVLVSDHGTMVGIITKIDLIAKFFL
ncbi:MAG: CBS domain-containing protein [Candidatus Verstraetearchaeota archaeon]|nr:CBS domain-containing protein [Candidatus Verstraetearchaeota archaeon]